MTLAERTKIIDEFVKQHKFKTKVTRAHVAAYGLNYLNRGHSLEHTPHNFEAMLQLQTILPKEYWVPEDVTRLQGLAAALTDRETYYPRYLEKNGVSDEEIERLSKRLAGKAELIRRAIVKPGGNPPAQAVERMTRERALRERNEKLVGEIENLRRELSSQSQYLNGRIADFQSQVKNREKEHTELRRRATESERAASNLRASMLEALDHIYSAHPQIGVVMRPKTVKDVKNRLDKAVLALKRR